MSKHLQETKYGVTWATREDSIAQTGYVFNTIEIAKAAAILGPDKQTVQVDIMWKGKLSEDAQVWGRIECEHDEHGEYLVQQSVSKHSFSKGDRVYWTDPGDD